jgi:hypothetical protein
MRQTVLAASLMLTAATDLHNVLGVFAILAAIFVVVCDRTTATRMRALFRLIVCHSDTLFDERKSLRTLGASQGLLKFMLDLMPLRVNPVSGPAHARQRFITPTRYCGHTLLCPHFIEDSR